MSLPYWPRANGPATSANDPPKQVVSPGQAFGAGSANPPLQFNVKPGHSYAAYFTASNLGWFSVSTPNPGIFYSLTTDLNNSGNSTATPLLFSNAINYVSNNNYSVNMFLTVPSSTSNTVPCYFRCNILDTNILANYNGVLTSGLYLVDLGVNT
jgi:hypothetical protein